MKNGSADNDTDNEDGEVTWIEWHCSMRGNEFLCMVDESFVEDEFNSYGLQSYVGNYNAAIEMILDIEPNEEYTEEEQIEIAKDAEILYGLLHARYITTNPGLVQMKEKYDKKVFGACPRLLCEENPLLPVGLSDFPNEDTVKMFCPRCGNLYACRSGRVAKLDGAYFGTTFPHLLGLVTRSEKKEKKKEKNEVSYVPRVFGFEIANNRGTASPSSVKLPVRNFCFYEK